MNKFLKKIAILILLLIVLGQLSRLIDYWSGPYWANVKNLSDIDFSTANETTKRVILRDAIVIAHIDNVYTHKEATFVQDLANRLGVQDDLVEKIESWLLEYWAILEEGKDLFSIQSD